MILKWKQSALVCVAAGLTALAPLAASGADAAAADPAAMDPAPPPQDQGQASQPAFKLTPYGRVELDIIGSSRGTNPLDPRQFNGYSTAAGPEPHSSSTFNPRFSVLGMQADVNQANQQVQAKVEVDFYSTDSANLITPRLRLAYVQYTRQQTKITAGMDWNPVVPLLPDSVDFSCWGTGGNLWQRRPKVTIRRGIGKNWEVMGTVMRFERGFTLDSKQFGGTDPFNDPIKMPYIGARIAYQKWGAGGNGMVAVSGAYRQFESPLTRNLTLKSHLVNFEFVVPILASVRWSGKIGHGQGLGDEFFRFGQAFNNRGLPIRTTAGWTELGYYGSKWSVAGGWGDDDPNDTDLRSISNNNGNYTHNQRIFVNALYDLFAHVKVGGEYNYLRTNWTNGDLFKAHQVMGVVFYSF